MGNPNDMTTVGPNPQPAIVGVPEVDPSSGAAAPFAYLSPAMATDLGAAMGYDMPAPVTELHVLVASMRLDQEGPFQGVKFNATQERSWPRTFRYGWPNIIAAPTPIMVAIQNPGAWPLNYEDVIPKQIVLWCVLDIWKRLSLPQLKQVMSESVTGASVRYAPPLGAAGGWESPVDEMMSSLLSPFLLRSGRMSAFAHLTGM
jgi:hypothetical protein